MASFPTALTPTTRYFPVSVRRFYFLTTIAAPASPTRAEMTAGTDLTAEIVDGGVSGFALSGAVVDIPDLGSRFTSNIPARQTAASSSIKFYADSSSADVRTLFLAQPNSTSTTGFILILEEGEYVSSKVKTMDVWPISVTSDAIDQATANAGQLEVMFAIPSKPFLNVTIPTNP